MLVTSVSVHTYFPNIFFFLVKNIDMAQWLDRLPHMREARGSNPTGSNNFFLLFFFIVFLTHFFMSRNHLPKGRIRLSVSCVEINHLDLLIA